MALRECKHPVPVLRPHAWESRPDGKRSDREARTVRYGDTTPDYIAVEPLTTHKKSFVPLAIIECISPAIAPLFHRVTAMGGAFI